MRFRPVALAAFAALAAVSNAAGVNSMAVPKLHGTVGPGYTISLKDAHGTRR